MQGLWQFLYLAFGRSLDEGWLPAIGAALLSLITGYLDWMWLSGASALLAVWVTTRAVRLRRILRRSYKP
jgi:hypothetical protein